MNLMVGKAHLLKDTDPVLKYRSDIDGLRAIAVLLVVGFHAFPVWGRGGLIGVDIFFVISGFLISRIIYDKLDHESFSFIDFYSRRIRRIFPALLIVLVSCFFIGWFVLLADEFEQLGRHIAGGAGFVSNLLLFGESGYFDNAAETKPLLHLWSLGIEEQFYLFWPFLMWGAWKQRYNLLKVTFFIVMSSFFLNVFMMRRDAVATFYLPQTRMWELLAGALLANIMLYHQKLVINFGRVLGQYFKAGKATGSNNEYSGNSSNILSWLGFILILTGFLFIDRKSTFPGWLALLPTSGAVCFLAAGKKGWINRTILSNRLLVWVGLISYPLYLWHWPLLSYARIIQSGHPDRTVRIAVVLLSIFLSWITYRLVEKPLRFGPSGKAKVLVLLSMMSITGGVGYVCYLSDGFPQRSVVLLNPDKRSGFDGGFSKKYLLDDCGVTGKDKKFAYCTQDLRQTPRFAMIGDSKAAALFTGLFRTSKEGGRWLFMGGNNKYGSPAPVLSDQPIYKRYQRLAGAAINGVISQDNIETVALVTATRVLFNLENDRTIKDLPSNTNYQLALDGLGRAVNKLVTAGKNVVLVVDNPTFPDPRDCMERETSSMFLNRLLLGGPNEDCSIKIEKHVSLSSKYRELLLEIAAMHPNRVHVFDTMKYLCDMEAGVCRSHKDGRFLYSYSDHLSDYGAGLIGKGLNEYLMQSNQ